VDIAADRQLEITLCIRGCLTLRRLVNWVVGPSAALRGRTPKLATVERVSLTNIDSGAEHSDSESPLRPPTHLLRRRESHGHETAMSSAVEMSERRGSRPPTPQAAAVAAAAAAFVAEAAPPVPTEEHGPKEPDESIPQQLKKFLTGSKVNVLLIFVFIAFISGFGKWSDSVTFTTSFLALIPLAAALGDFTEDIAKRTNDATAALINVTFGNATELIISLVALKYGQFDIIKFSLIGSIIGNMLLVLGTSFLLAGLKNRSLTFNPAATNSYLSTLILSCLCFVGPTAYSTIDAAAANPIYTLRVSREISVLMIGVYVAYLYFQQKTHRHLFDEQPASPRDAADGGAAATTGASGQAAVQDDDDDDDDPEYSFWFSFVGTAIVALLISVLSDFLVDSLEGAAEGLHLSRHFIGLVLVPIVGNVAEHASAIMMAMKMKLDIAIGVALGSSVQIGMFVMPIICLCGTFMGQDLDLTMGTFTTATLFVTVLLTFAVSNAGSATWLSGLKLTAAYAILALAFFHAPD
jgi:Ca2+:H+ antiporter